VRRLVLLPLTAALALPAWPASAQETSPVRLLLVDQTAIATPEPGDPLRVEVRAVNDGDVEYRDLTLAVTVSSAVRSRSAYAQSLEAGPISPLGIKVFRLPGVLSPGGGRTFEVEWERLAFLADRDEDALYPVTVELRSADVQVGVLRTAVIFMVNSPKAPLNVSLSVVLDAPIRIRPDGVLLDQTMEEQVSDGGRLDVIVTALEEEPVPVTVVVSPLLLEVLHDMRDGYRVFSGPVIEDRAPDAPTALAAGRILERLRTVAARTTTTELVALPYASPSVPALIDAGLDDDLEEQISRGRQVVQAILGVPPSQTVFRPPGSTLTEESLTDLAETLAADGTTEALLVDAEVLPPPPGLTLTPHGATTIAVDDKALTAVVPDPVVELRTAPPASPAPDPRLAAMWTLGELASLYFERPSVDRGAAVLFGEGDAPQGALLKTLLRGMQQPAEVRWLRPVKVTRVAVGQDPDDPPVARELETPAHLPGLPSAALDGLNLAEDGIAALDSMADNPPLLDQLRRQILLSQSRYLAGHEDERLAFLRSVRLAVAGEFGKIRPPQASSVTLTSRGGIIPVTLHNDAGYPVEVELTLRSARLRFVGGPSRTVQLARPVQQFAFPVRAQTTGRFPVRVELATPDGEPIGSSRIVVRSTAYNSVALLITAGAALFLAVWWGRRLLSRRRA
jgi:hypothetical protein